MKFVSTWSLRPATHREAEARFLKGGAKPPEGVRTIGRWHYTDGSGGVHIFECDDAQVMIDFAAEWSDVLEIETRPVVDDAQVGAALAKTAQTRK
jgi:Protein of unknown function (DUF3303)